MTIDKQRSEVHRILTHLNGLNACDIGKIIEKVNAKVGHSREIVAKSY